MPGLYSNTSKNQLIHILASAPLQQVQWYLRQSPLAPLQPAHQHSVTDHIVLQCFFFCDTCQQWSIERCCKHAACLQCTSKHMSDYAAPKNTHVCRCYESVTCLFLSFSRSQALPSFLLLLQKFFNFYMCPRGDMLPCLQRLGTLDCFCLLMEPLPSIHLLQGHVWHVQQDMQG
jgi:hypothetical protein